MVIEIDTERDTPEEIHQKIAVAAQAAREAAKQKSLAHLCDSVQWEEDAVAYQQRLRDEWTRDGWE